VTLRERFQREPYAGYAYAYPHKTAYRPLAPPRQLHDVWADEPRNPLFLYFHIPFCESKCAYCNLFSTRDDRTAIERYVAAVRRQIHTVAEELGPVGIATAALGGGTPSLLSEAQLESLFATAEATFGVAWGQIPVSAEVSPGTGTASKLRLLHRLGVTRLSVGIQSFQADELRALARPQSAKQTAQALDLAREIGFPTLNLDLIYGIPGQTPESWRASLHQALQSQPEELYLYPLYRRPHTALARKRVVLDQRPALYRLGRDHLLAAGYEQLSMRCFRLPRPRLPAAPDYCCQQDGMVGLGCGARSYTRALHYGWEYAASPARVRQLVAAFADPHTDHALVSHGFRLDRAEQQRRFVIKSLLRKPGLALDRFQEQFDVSPALALPALRQLLDEGLMTEEEGALVLTGEGLAWSDAIGPWLYSAAARERMEDELCP